jgi:hypothetical protein
MLRVPDEGEEVSMKSLERIIRWLEDRQAAYEFTDRGLKAKVLLKENERLVRVTRGPKGNLIGRVKGDSRVVVFPEVFTEELEEGRVLACRIVERDRYFIAIPLSIQSRPEDGVSIFWIERP